MKGIFTALVLVLAFSASALCQNTNVCPMIKVNAPTSLILPGEIMNFSVEVGNDVEISNLKFVWTVSAGTIIEGQNTPAIRVITTSDMQGVIINAKVEVQGLPENCENRASQPGETVTIPKCRCGDEYGKIPWRDERARLENFAIELRNNPNARAYILLNLGEKLTLNQAKKHAGKMARYLQSLKVDKKRLLFAIKPGEFRLTTLNLFPDEKKFPLCDECEFINGENTK